MGVEAGDRALEAARKIVHYFLEPDSESRLEHHIPPIAALIQSAMNAQEREVYGALQTSYESLKLAVRAMEMFESHERREIFTHTKIQVRVGIAEAERLLAERGGTK